MHLFLKAEQSLAVETYNVYFKMSFYDIISYQQTPFLARCIKIEKCVIDKYETISNYQICSSKSGGKTPTKYNDNFGSTLICVCINFNRFMCCHDFKITRNKKNIIQSSPIHSAAQSWKLLVTFDSLSITKILKYKTTSLILWWWRNEKLKKVEKVYIIYYR